MVISLARDKIEIRHYVGGLVPSFGRRSAWMPCSFAKVSATERQPQFQKALTDNGETSKHKSQTLKGGQPAFR